MHVNVSSTVKTVGGISLFNGAKLEESEGQLLFSMCYLSVLVHDLLSNKSQFAGQL